MLIGLRAVDCIFRTDAVADGETMTRIPSLLTGLACLAIALAVVANSRKGSVRDIPHTSVSEMARTAQSGGLATDHSANESNAIVTEKASPQFAVTVNHPSGPPHIQLGTDPQGRPAKVACSTCHSVREPDLNNRLPDQLDEFHQGMQLDHGQLACYACHNPQDANTLRLADGTSVDFPQVMVLCSQCHGPQATAYAHGAHGGMNGYWDLSRGPQQRNNCIDCHDPHAPRFPKMILNFKPRDRFLNSAEADAHVPATKH